MVEETSRAFLEGRCHLEPCNPCDYEATISSVFKAAVVGNSHKAAFPLYPIWLLGKQSLNGSGVLGCKLDWNVPGKSPLGLCLITSCSYL